MLIHSLYNHHMKSGSMPYADVSKKQVGGGMPRSNQNF